mgnify:CR=1 FL=1
MNSEIERHLEKASGKLRVAKKLAEMGEYEDSISRAYYAMYHAAKAALLRKGSSPKTHEGVAREFGRIFLKTGVLPEKTGKSLLTAKAFREKGDYVPTFEASKAETFQIVKDAEDFLDLIRTHLRVTST